MAVPGLGSSWPSDKGADCGLTLAPTLVDGVLPAGVPVPGCTAGTGEVAGLGAGVGNGVWPPLYCGDSIKVVSRVADLC